MRDSSWLVHGSTLMVERPPKDGRSVVSRKIGLFAVLIALAAFFLTAAIAALALAIALTAFFLAAAIAALAFLAFTCHGVGTLAAGRALAEAAASAGALVSASSLASTHALASSGALGPGGALFGALSLAAHALALIGAAPVVVGHDYTPLQVPPTA
jgi:hypothetical protein